MGIYLVDIQVQSHIDKCLWCLFGLIFCDLHGIIFLEVVQMKHSTYIFDFDDNIGAISTASQAGLYTVGVYDKSGEDFADKLKELSDAYIKSFVGARLI